MNPTGCLDHVGVSYPGFDLCDTLLRQGEIGGQPPEWKWDISPSSYFSLFSNSTWSSLFFIYHWHHQHYHWRDILNCQTWNRQSILMETLMRIHYICYIFISSMFPLNTIHALNVTCCKILWPVEEILCKRLFPLPGIWILTKSISQISNLKLSRSFSQEWKVSRQNSRRNVGIA